MYEYLLTVGLFDKNSERQEIATDAAERKIENLLIENFGIFAFTIFQCHGVYKMSSTNNIVREPSFRIEIATDAELENLPEIIEGLKAELNQESIMVKMQKSDIDFM